MGTLRFCLARLSLPLWTEAVLLWCLRCLLLIVESREANKLDFSEEQDNENYNNKLTVGAPTVLQFLKAFTAPDWMALMGGAARTDNKLV